ncbi:TIR domain-containing protein [Archangium gephyra]|uniref:TIR domain-containing protein n=1 Tax=Archangium gephyra TaxID=48 RepID=A0ABX9K029_9BACT|nr:toll/interleukin-1 receptor domain-containing protein [Archangium gephyra]REG30652.1 TIR domain-containing protein [Archangium gephyra]
MPYLHVVIELKSEPKHPEVKVDLTQDGLLEQFIAPYENGHPIVVNGRAIPLDDIKRLSVYETQEASAVLKQQVDARFDEAASEGIFISRRATDLDAARQGTVVSDRFIKGPPGVRRSLAARPPAPVPSGRTPLTPAPHGRDQVFISYSRKDKRWLDTLETYLKPHFRSQDMYIWNDTKIQPGARWQDEIKEALARAKVAVLLVTPEFLASDFIAQHELPQLLDAARNEGTTILWLPIKASGYQSTEIAQYQALLDPAKPLNMRHSAHRGKDMVAVAETIKKAFQS